MAFHWEAGGKLLRARLEEAISGAKIAAAELTSHMKECDRRYAEMTRQQDDRHHENTNRMNSQDRALNKILWSIIVGAVSLIGIMVETVARGVWHS